MSAGAADLKTASRSQTASIELQRQQEEADALHQKNQQAQEDAAEEKTIQQVYGEVQNDPTIPPEKKHDELIARLAGKIKPAALAALNEQIEEHDTLVRNASDDNLAESLKKNTEVDNALSAVLAAPETDRPAQYGVARQSLIRQGIAKPEDIPETYDPATVAVHQAAAMGATNSATAEISRREQANKDADERRRAREADQLTQPSPPGKGGNVASSSVREERTNCDGFYKKGRPRMHVDLVEVIGRRWAGESFPAIARRMHLGYGTVVRAYHTATVALQAVQKPKAATLRAVKPGVQASGIDSEASYR
jgi:hypothetical protein